MEIIKYGISLGIFWNYDMAQIKLGCTQIKTGEENTPSIPS